MSLAITGANWVGEHTSGLIGDVRHMDQDEAYHARAIYLPYLIQYTIQSGDTLTRIAKKFGSSVSALAGFNKVVDVDILRVGDKLLIPK